MASAEFVSYAGGASMGTHLTTSKTQHQQRGLWRKIVRHKEQTQKEVQRCSRQPQRWPPATYGRDHDGAGGCFLKDSSPWEVSHAGAEKQTEKEGVAERSCYGLTTTSLPHPPAPLRTHGGKQAEVCELHSENDRGKKSWKGGERVGFLNIAFVSHYLRLF